jgi:hypothetical protein
MVSIMINNENENDNININENENDNININENENNENINNDERNIFNVNEIINDDDDLRENLFNEIDNIFNVNQPRMYHLILWINILIRRRVDIDYISTNILEIYAIFNDNYVNLDNIKHKTLLLLILYRRINTLQNNRDALYNIMFHCLQLE